MDYAGFNQVYEKGSKTLMHHSVFRIHTDMGISGEYPVRAAQAKHQLTLVADYLLGKDPFQREKIYSDLKRGLRHTDRTGIKIVDVALWKRVGDRMDLMVDPACEYET